MTPEQFEQLAMNHDLHFKYETYKEYIVYEKEYMFYFNVENQYFETYEKNHMDEPIKFVGYSIGYESMMNVINNIQMGELELFS